MIGQVHHSSAEHFFVSVAPYTTNALLPLLSFEKATRKTRPILPPGALVYARVVSNNRHMDAELECVSAATGKADGLGPLVGGTVFPVSPAMARRLLMPSSRRSGVVVLEELAASKSSGGGGLAFETAVGRNGKIWVSADSPRAVLLVGRAVTETDEAGLDAAAQKKLVRRLLRELA